MKKKVMSVLLSTAMAAALMSGCGSSAGKESSTAGEEKSAGGSKTVTMMCWYTEDDMQRVIDAINEKLGGRPPSSRSAVSTQCIEHSAGRGRRPRCNSGWRKFPGEN